jgi:subtilisin family serine protease
MHTSPRASLILLATFAACASPQAAHQLAAPPAEQRIDAPVRAAMDSGAATVQVILLGKSQLMEPLGGFDRFAREHDGADRLTLRRQTVAQLKRMAATQQRDILRALGRDSATRALWIVNALVLSLSPDEIRRAAQLDDVAFIYRTIENIRPQEATPAMPVVDPAASRAFAAGGRRVAWNVAMLNAPRVWNELGITGEGATVAVLDFGMNYLHNDIAANLWRNTREVPGNGRDDDGNGFIDDVHGYDFAVMKPNVYDTTGRYQNGTVVSGIVAGDGSSGIITGVAPRARLMMMRGNGPTAAALAHQYALENGADILSMSFSLANIGNLRGWWRMMSDHATAAGLFLVGGAGNFRTSAQIPVQHWAPKDAPNVVSVGGVDSSLNIVNFSSGGPAEWSTVALYRDYPMPNGITKPDVAGFPGGYPILGAGKTGYIDPNPDVKGNSFSGPQGAGIAALMFAAAPELPAWRVRQIMERTARDLGPPGKDNDFGAGLMDAFAAVSEARRSRK